MRRLTPAMVLLALVFPGRLAGAPPADLDDLPAPPQLPLCALCFNMGALHFLQEPVPLPPETLEPSDGAPDANPPWENLTTLRKGQKIRILDTNSRQISAQFVGVSDSFLQFKADGKTETIGRENVMMVSLQPPSKAKRILFGVLAGALTGLSIWETVDREVRDCWCDGGCCERDQGLSSRSAAILIAIGAGVGGSAAGLVKADELVIYYRNWKAPYQLPLNSELPPDPEAAGSPAPPTRDEVGPRPQDVSEMPQ